MTRKIFLCALLALGLTACSKVTKENYDQIKMGMNYDEIVTLIGEPASCDDALGVSHCVWGDENSNINVSFVANKATVFTAKGLK